MPKSVETGGWFSICRDSTNSNSLMTLGVGINSIERTLLVADEYRHITAKAKATLNHAIGLAIVYDSSLYTSGVISQPFSMAIMTK